MQKESSMVYVISLDVGTSSMRAILYNKYGEILVSFGYEYHTVFPRPSYVEQDPATWEYAAVKVLSDMAEYINDKGIFASVISVTSQRASLIPVGATGKPLYNAIMWQDKRTIDICHRLENEYGLKYLYRKTGLRVNPFFVLNKLIWLRENEPGIFADSVKFVGVQDYVIHFLTGEYVTDWTQASRTMLMDLKELRWDEDLLRLAGIGADKLCRLDPPGTYAGKLLKTIADRCGLPSGLPVIISGGDQQNAALALGVTRPGMAEANTGTGSFLLSYTDKPVFDDECRVICQAGASAGSYVTETAIFNTGSIFRWFKEQFCPDYVEADDPYDRMCQEADKEVYDGDGIVMLPHFEGSAAPNWNPKAKGVFFNLGLASTRGMMIRSIMEGIALEIAENLELMRSLIGDIDEVHVAGGMTRSDLFCSMQASAYGTKVVRRRNPEASSLGACCNAMVALGVYNSPEHFLAEIRTADNKGNDEFLPDAKARSKYKSLMQKRKALYSALDSNKVYDLFMS
jgi:glycerol kinase